MTNTNLVPGGNLHTKVSPDYAVKCPVVFRIFMLDLVDCGHFGA